jgi:hypothetical protein
MLDTLKRIWTSWWLGPEDPFFEDLARDFPGKTLEEIVDASPFSVYWEQGMEGTLAVIDDRIGKCVGGENGLSYGFSTTEDANRFIVELIRKERV